MDEARCIDLAARLMPRCVCWFFWRNFRAKLKSGTSWAYGVPTGLKWPGAGVIRSTSSHGQRIVWVSGRQADDDSHLAVGCFHVHRGVCPHQKREPLEGVVASLGLRAGAEEAVRTPCVPKADGVTVVDGATNRCER